jgi:hypothetical protein
MSQLSYLQEHVAGYAGDLADSDLDKRILAMRNNSGADLPFGRMVASAKADTGGSDIAARLPGTAMTDTLIGIAVRSAARAAGPIDTTGTDGVRDDDMFDVLTKGGAYVAPEVDITAPTDGVFVRIGPGTATDGSMDAPGTFRNDIDAHTAWVRKTAYSKLDRRSYNGKVYQCITAGTSEDAADPSGIVGAPTGAAITDGTAVWKYLGVCDASTRASAVAVTGAKWRVSGTAASKLAKVELNLP